jgi:catechol 2,3-dioxygenase-like lactoylglutathione lyase family enzyme
MTTHKNQVSFIPNIQFFYILYKTSKMSFKLYSASVALYHIVTYEASQMLTRLLITTICLLLYITLPPIVHGQSQITDTSSFTTTGAFFALSVVDLEASTKWYSEKLGLKVIMKVPKQNKSTVCVLEGGGLIVELIKNDDARPLRVIAPAINDNLFVHGIFKVGAIVGDLDKMLSMFKKLGVEIVFGPFPSLPDQRSNVIIKDNSGNLIQFFGK